MWSHSFTPFSSKSGFPPTVASSLKSALFPLASLSHFHSSLQNALITWNDSLSFEQMHPLICVFAHVLIEGRLKGRITPVSLGSKTWSYLLEKLKQHRYIWGITNILVYCSRNEIPLAKSAGAAAAILSVLDQSKPLENLGNINCLRLFDEGGNLYVEWVRAFGGSVLRSTGAYPSQGSEKDATGGYEPISFVLERARECGAGPALTSLIKQMELSGKSQQYDKGFQNFLSLLVANETAYQAKVAPELARVAKAREESEARNAALRAERLAVQEVKRKAAALKTKEKSDAEKAATAAAVATAAATYGATTPAALKELLRLSR